MHLQHYTDFKIFVVRDEVQRLPSLAFLFYYGTEEMFLKTSFKVVRRLSPQESVRVLEKLRGPGFRFPQTDFLFGRDYAKDYV